MNVPGQHERRRQRQLQMAIVIVREIAAEVSRGMPADAALGCIFKQHPEFGSRDRRHYSHVVFSYFRWLGWTRMIAPENLEQQCAWAVMLDPASDADIRSMWNEYTGMNEQELNQLVPLSVFEKAECLMKWKKSPELTRANLMPEWLTDEITPPDLRNSIIHSCSSRPPSWVRVRPDQIERFSEMLTAQQIRFSMNNNIPGAIALESPFQLQQLERAWGQAIQVQDISSQMVGIICAAKPGESWWDACSGAGGKTIALAENVGENGAILATDIRESILQNLIHRANKRRLSNIITRLLDASQHAADGILFDGILIDAPCSGIGTWSRNPDARWRLQREDISTRAALQLNILHHAAACLRPRGRLVYSVCTLTDAETHGVIETFLQQHSEFTREEFIDPASKNKMLGELTIRPSDGPGDGMFIGVLRRK